MEAFLGVLAVGVIVGQYFNILGELIDSLGSISYNSV